METTYYSKHRGWNGDIYYVRMTEKEVEFRRKLGVVLSVLIMPPVMTFIFAICAGVIKL